MDTKQWSTVLNESIAACDMTDVLRQTENWFNQGFDYWKAWNTMASSYAAPQKWMDTAGGISKTMENLMQDWARLYGLGPNAASQEDPAQQKRQAQKAEAALESMKKERASLKRSLSLKDKTLEAQRTEIAQHQNKLKESEEKIQVLQTKVKTQAERLILLEAAGKKEIKSAPAKQKGATVPPAGK